MVNKNKEKGENIRGAGKKRVENNRRRRNRMPREGETGIR